MNESTEPFFAADSAARRVCRERAILLFAPRVVLLQYAHPAFAAASSVYSARDSAPGARFIRAATTLSSMVFGDRANADRHAGRVRRKHDHLNGPGWSASDPAALAWIYITLLDGVLSGADLVRGRRDETLETAFFGDARRFGALFDVAEHDIPASRAALNDAITNAVRHTLRVGDETKAMWTFLTMPSGPSWGEGLRAGFLARWSATTLPEPMAEALGVSSLRSPKLAAVVRGLGPLGRLLPKKRRFVSDALSRTLLR